MNERVVAPQLPRAFCWTRFGPEAGEKIQQIINRKEAERRATGGLLLWGVGNSVAPAMAELVRHVDAPEALFSPIRSRPRAVDVDPGCVVRWTEAEDLFGARFELPEQTRVTSRWTPTRQRASHYALVCYSDKPLGLTDHGSVSFGALRNLRSGTPLGASQVTAVVERAADDRLTNDPQGAYVVALRAALAAPYFVRLLAPVAVEPRLDRLVDAARPRQLRLRPTSP